jgi:hypothetical protein
MRATPLALAGQTARGAAVRTPTDL